MLLRRGALEHAGGGARDGLEELDEGERGHLGRALDLVRHQHLAPHEANLGVVDAHHLDA